LFVNVFDVNSQPAILPYVAYTFPSISTPKEPIVLEAPPCFLLQISQSFLPFKAISSILYAVSCAPPLIKL
jgi:hypothetical protein